MDTIGRKILSAPFWAMAFVGLLILMAGVKIAETIWPDWWRE